MAGMLIDSSRKQWRLGVLLFGLLMLVLAVTGTIKGKLYGWGRGGTVDRANAPWTYWLGQVVRYLGAAFLIWCWYELPH